MTSRLPKALIASNDWLGLTQSQQFNFESRIKYINEIVDNISEWLEGSSEWGSLSEFLDDLELDVSVNQNLNSDEDFVSSWLIHSTWGNSERDRISAALLPSVVISALDRPLPDIEIGNAAVTAWLKLHRDALQASLGAFYNSTAFSEVLSSILVFDTLMAMLLCGLYKLRFR